MHSNMYYYTSRLQPVIIHLLTLNVYSSTRMRVRNNDVKIIIYLALTTHLSSVQAQEVPVLAQVITNSILGVSWIFSGHYLQSNSHSLSQ